MQVLIFWLLNVTHKKTVQIWGDLPPGASSPVRPEIGNPKVWLTYLRTYMGRCKRHLRVFCGFELVCILYRNGVLWDSSFRFGKSWFYEGTSSCPNSPKFSNFFAGLGPLCPRRGYFTAEANMSQKMKYIFTIFQYPASLVSGQ